MDLELLPVDKYTDTAISMVVTYAPQLVLALVTLFVGLWVIKGILAGAQSAFSRAEVEATLQKFLLSLIGVGLKGLLIISVASMIGIETTSFIAVLGAAGLAVGLALQGSLANFAGGVLILLFKPYKIGDFIDAKGHMGTVREIGIFHTIMTTGDNKTIIIPNGAVSNSAITNFSAQATRRVDIIFGIGYDDDLRLAKDILRGLIEADERILKDPLPLIAISTLGDSSVDITTRSWVDAANYWPVLFDLTENTKLAFDAAGISIPFPQTDVHLYQGNKA
ncbi:MAG: mechanosensitive ion channel [SAR86 cluster bacterium]|jgi:small conductance mechanosensitive channel|uniref:Small-conductance mechanosensitive channel n=1 Tax=SAR86 cluster bacterium TaxID=2030880 RepID=A0A972VX06_9GAMM|nr:mechanosensitive ion channel [Pseudomonadales bacterium]NQV65141.1 mechanosensitive ion channel [SAR86 cluster bacterium]|tara:strand:+ start:30338 stop:31174 length:837 start_codon:yes stop_codon:yes gene_type:complete